jgi:hypothetical protein
MVDQLTDLFRTTYRVKTQEVVKNRGQHCGDIDLVGYLANESGPVPKKKNIVPTTTTGRRVWYHL